MSVETELAWAAGFFDGEGTACLCVNNYRGSKYMRPACAIFQNDRDLLDRFQSAVGVGSVYATSNGHYQWYTSKKSNIRVVYNLLKPYLGPFKTRDFEKTLYTEPRFCPVCSKELDPDKYATAIYCSAGCRNSKANILRKEAKLK